MAGEPRWPSIPVICSLGPIGAMEWRRFQGGGYQLVWGRHPNFGARDPLQKFPGKFLSVAQAAETLPAPFYSVWRLRPRFAAAWRHNHDRGQVSSLLFPVNRGPAHENPLQFMWLACNTASNFTPTATSFGSVTPARTFKFFQPLQRQEQQATRFAPSGKRIWLICR